MTDVLEIARLRMRNSGLGGAFGTPTNVVSWQLAMQAQDYGPAKWAIAQRATGVADADIERALTEAAVVRTHVLRPTWHFVCGVDLHWLLALTGPRIQQGMARRYRELGLDEDVRGRARETVAAALRGTQMTRDEIGTLLKQDGIDPSTQRLPYLLSDSELQGVICSGQRRGKHHTYALVDERLPKPQPFDRDEALVQLVRRYLLSHGPATVHDMSWWSSLTVSDIKSALRDLGDEVDSRSIDGTELWSLSSSSDAPEGVGRGVHLLQTYDELIVGYTRSRFFGDPRADLARAAWKDRKLPNGLVLLDGAIAGHWRRTMATKAVDVEFALYERPTEAEEEALKSAATRLAGFLGREPRLHVRVFNH